MVYFRFWNRRRIFVLCRRHIYFYIVVASVICFVIYTEIISYIINTNSWYHLRCINSNQCLKILLVADPQITGHEKLEFLSSLAQYDSDSYIKKTYHHAFNFIQPNVTIFLGDLMDEGSIATDQEHTEYLKRFFNIFPKLGGKKQIWLPGDNDIGGENWDRITTNKIHRYDKAFAQANILEFEKVKFVKVNRLVHSIPKLIQKRDFYNTSEIFVVLSHMPLMFMPSVFVEKVFSKVQPQLIFAAHQHKAMIVSTDGLLRQDRQILPLNPADNKAYHFSLGSSDMYEIIVPTCSYRMGTRKIGFGYAILENEDLQYTVLWSPSRFHQLWNYFCLLVIIFISLILVKFCQ